MKTFFSVALILLSLSFMARSDNIDIAEQCVLNVEEVDGFYVSRRLASVRIGEGGGCSGTIIAVGDWHGEETAFGLTASHCGYQLNQIFTINFVDGSRAKARCIDIDSPNDLMLFVVSAKHVIGVAPFSEEDLHDDCYAVGFPGVIGPNEKSIRHLERGTMQDSTNGRTYERDHWQVRTGLHAHGDSGGGIFDGDNLVGVLSHGDPDGTPNMQMTIRSSTQPQIAKLLKRNKKIKRRNCTNGQCTAGGPRDLWWLKPNVDIAVPNKPNRPEHLIDNPRRPDINGDREQKKAIAELQLAMQQLQQRVEKLESVELPAESDGDEPPAAPPIGYDDGQVESIVKRVIGGMNLRGPAGPAGDRGPAGEPGPSRSVEVVLKWDDGTIISRGTLPPGKNRAIQTLKRRTVERSAVVQK